MLAGNKKSFAGKKILVFGLGLLGGGVATTNWLLKQGADVTITDLKTKRQLKSALKKIKGKVKVVLGGHREKDIKNNDCLVINPDVPFSNPFVKLARKLGKEIENEATLFYKFWDKKTIAVTGTRGKTTTANWIGHFLSSCSRPVVAGNSFSSPLLSVLDKSKKFDWAVTELPSFLLEFFDSVKHGPDIAVITNLSQDHLNRHQTLKKYALVKSGIFKNQSQNQNLVLNYDNSWTPYFQKTKPKAILWFFSLKPLKPGINGIFYKNGSIYFKDRNKFAKVLSAKNFSAERGEHNLANLLASALAARLAGCSWPSIQRKIKSLPQISFRQETIFDNGKLKVINDTTATSPEGGIAALKRFGAKNCVLIAGGTDRKLDFRNWAKELRRWINPENIILLSGSATDKMIKLFENRELKKIEIRDTLADCVKAGLKKARKYPKAILLFSPASKSFEKFKNEYDRGEQFNQFDFSKSYDKLN